MFKSTGRSSPNMRIQAIGGIKAVGTRNEMYRTWSRRFVLAGITCVFVTMLVVIMRP